jgi:hypothetical protein
VRAAGRKRPDEDRTVVEEIPDRRRTKPFANNITAIEPEKKNLKKPTKTKFVKNG